MTEQDFIDAWALLFSGAGEMKNAREMFIGEHTTIEFLSMSPKRAIVRIYYPDANICYEESKYLDGKLNGRLVRRWSDGTKLSEVEFKDGKLDGKCITYYSDRREIKMFENGIEII